MHSVHCVHCYIIMFKHPLRLVGPSIVLLSPILQGDRPFCLFTKYAPHSKNSTGPWIPHYHTCTLLGMTATQGCKTWIKAVKWNTVLYMPSRFYVTAEDTRLVEYMWKFGTFRNGTQRNETTTYCWPRDSETCLPGSVLQFYGFTPTHWISA